MPTQAPPVAKACRSLPIQAATAVEADLAEVATDLAEEATALAEEDLSEPFINPKRQTS